MGVRLKKKRHLEVDTEGSWAISYGDMITLLLSFFVIFFSFDFKNEKDQKLTEHAIENISLINHDKNEKIGLVENQKVDAEDLSEITTIVQKTSDGRMIVLFKGANFFSTGSENVNEFGQKLLNKFAAKYLPYAGKFKLKIQAFTDDRPVLNETSRFKDNIELSALRSISILRYLREKGIPLNRVEIGGKGIMSNKLLQLLKIKSNDKEEIRKMSRTVAFILSREEIS